MPKHTLITGGAGFIGSHLAQRLLENGHKVTAVDTLTPFYPKSIKRRNVEHCQQTAEKCNTQYRFEREDAGSAVIGPLLKDIDIVYHFAARAGVRESAENPKLTHRQNANTTLGLLETIRKAETSIDRLIVASSSSVYGDAGEPPYSETVATAPESPYAASKLATEKYALSYTETYGIPAVALRFFTVYGERMRPHMAISNFTTRCLDRTPPEIHGSGEQRRDFTNIRDVVHACIRLLNTDMADGRALNIGSGNSVTINHLASEICSITGYTPESGSKFEHTDRHQADSDCTHADITLANRLIGYDPRIELQTGLQYFTRWCEENPEFYAGAY